MNKIIKIKTALNQKQVIFTTAAFTLIELLVVIAIVGILSGLIIVGMSNTTNSANDAKRKANIETIRKALLMYQANNGGTYPTGVAELAGCNIGAPVGSVPCSGFSSALAILLPNPPVDPVFKYYIYISDGTSFTISAALSSEKVYGYSSLTGFYSSIFTRSSYYGTRNKIRGNTGYFPVDDSANGALWGNVYNFTIDGWGAYAPIGPSSQNYGFQAGTYDVYVRIRTNGLGSATSLNLGNYNTTLTNNTPVITPTSITGLTSTYQIKYAGRFTLTAPLLSNAIDFYLSGTFNPTNFFVDYEEFRLVN